MSSLSEFEIVSLMALTWYEVRPGLNRQSFLQGIIRRPSVCNNFERRFILSL